MLIAQYDGVYKISPAGPSTFLATIISYSLLLVIAPTLTIIL